MNYWIWLASIEMLGSIKTKKLLERFKEPENIFHARKEDILAIDGIGDKIYENILNSKKDIEKINKIEAYMNKNNIGMFKLGDDVYPKKLSEIYDPPVILFYKGNLELLNNKNMAIIGSRKPSAYGMRIAQKIGKDISIMRDECCKWACQRHRCICTLPGLCLQIKIQSQ